MWARTGGFCQPGDTEQGGAGRGMLAPSQSGFEELVDPHSKPKNEEAFVKYLGLTPTCCRSLGAVFSLSSFFGAKKQGKHSQRWATDGSPVRAFLVPQSFLEQLCWKESLFKQAA